jgi:hypothetical protein
MSTFPSSLLHSALKLNKRRLNACLNDVLIDLVRACGSSDNSIERGILTGYWPEGDELIAMGYDLLKLVADHGVQPNGVAAFRILSYAFEHFDSGHRLISIPGMIDMLVEFPDSEISALQFRLLTDVGLKLQPMLDMRQSRLDMLAVDERVLELLFAEADNTTGQAMMSINRPSPALDGRLKGNNALEALASLCSSTKGKRANEDFCPPAKERASD